MATADVGLAWQASEVMSTLGGDYCELLLQAGAAEELALLLQVMGGGEGEHHGAMLASLGIDHVHLRAVVGRMCAGFHGCSLPYRSPASSLVTPPHSSATLPCTIFAGCCGTLQALSPRPTVMPYGISWRALPSSQLPPPPLAVS